MSSPRDLRGERGITIVEAMIAAAVMLVAMLAGFLSIESASNATKGAERQAIAAAAGEEELERLAGLPYGRIAHCSSPAHDPDPGAPAGEVPERPAHFVTTHSPPRLRVLADHRDPDSGPLPGTGGGEQLVVGGADCALATPQTRFQSGGVSGDIWRFVTYRRETCPPELPQLTAPLNGLLGGALNLLASVLGSLTASINLGVNLFCNQPRDSKRITVAVTVDEASTLGPRKPIWMSTIVTNDQNGLLLDEPSLLDF